MAEENEQLPHQLHSTFISLRNPNFRIYFVTQALSNIGTWIQITAENWLILQLTHSGWALGVTNALQFGPLVFLGLCGGVVADRFDRRRLLIVSQSALAILSGAIGLLVVADLIQLWMIWVAALLLGLIICIDRPALSSFIKDLVGEADLSNPVALNNAVISLGRMVGPVVSGLLIAYFGVAPSFFVNAISFAIAVFVLVTLDPARLHAPRPVERKAGQVLRNATSTLSIEKSRTPVRGCGPNLAHSSYVSNSPSDSFSASVSCRYFILSPPEPFYSARSALFSVRTILRGDRSLGENHACLD